MGARPAAPSRSIRLGVAAPLPVHLTHLLGRSAEIQGVSSLLEGHRLVSLVGPGGIGKSRLAAAVGGSLQNRYRDAVGWIELAPIVDPEVLGTFVAASLGLREQPGTDPLDALISLLRRGSALLIFDNCEHLLTASALLVDRLLRNCPSLRIVTTSRQPLGLAGEKIHAVPPLALPDSNSPSGSASAAVRLFVERASDVVPSFAVTPQNEAAVAQICRRLDGLPLAIELAAARIKLLPPEQLVARLDSMLGLLASGSAVHLPRHRTLRALIDWSYDLLSPEERRLFARLAIFSGGFTLDAVERVAGDASVADDEVLDLLAGLIDKSLVASSERQGEARFTLLDTVRQYALEKLEESGEMEGLRERHALFFIEFAEAAEPHILGGTRGTAWMSRLEAEHGNLRSALTWTGETTDRVELALRLRAALHWFHFARGHFSEPRRRLAAALEHADRVAPPYQGRALATLGYLAFWMGDFPAAVEPLATAVELLRDSGTPVDLSFALTGLATLHGLTGQGDAATSMFDEAERISGGAGPDPTEFARAIAYAFASFWRAAVAENIGDLELAERSLRKSVDVARQFGNHPSVAHPLTALARVTALRGALDIAEESLAEAIPVHLANDDQWGLIRAAEARALLASARRDPLLAATLLGAADRTRLRIGVLLAPHEAAERERITAMLREAVGTRELEKAISRGADSALEALLLSGRQRGTSSAEANASDVEFPVHPTASAQRQDVVDTPVPGTPADLQVQSLGPLRIAASGRPLEGDAFGSSKPRELLLFLLCSPHGCTREQVGAAFWPESSAAQVKNSFHVTLHRLRKALDKPDWITASGDRYHLAQAVGVEFDAVTFEREITAVLSGPDQGPATEHQLRKGLDLYGGEFLEGEIVGDWHLPIRDRLGRLWIQGTLALIDLMMGSGRYTEAADRCRALLARDRLHEPAYRRLMICLEKTGQRIEALRIYETLVTLLEAELGSTPSAETTALFQELQTEASPGTPLPL